MYKINWVKIDRHYSSIIPPSQVLIVTLYLNDLLFVHNSLPRLLLPDNHGTQISSSIAATIKSFSKPFKIETSASIMAIIDNFCIGIVLFLLL